MCESSRLPWFDDLKMVADAAAIQFKNSDRLGLALMTLSVFMLIPREIGVDIDIPFGLGKVPPVKFQGVGLALLGVLSLGVLQARSQAIRALKIAERLLESIESESAAFGPIHPRDVFDTITTPSLNRIAPLPQLTRGRYQFYPESLDCPSWLRTTAGLFYGYLKILSTFVYFVVPAVALWSSASSYLGSFASFLNVPSWAQLLALGFGIPLVLGGCLVLHSEVKHTFAVFHRIRSGLARPPPSA